MKKTILTVVLLTFGLACAQQVVVEEVAPSKTTQFGLKGGLNVANLAGDEKATAVPGAHIGLFAEFSISEKFSIQPELLFSMEGAKDNGVVTEAGIDYNLEEKIKLNYINIPLMAKYYVDKKFSVLAGPQIGFVVSAKDKFTVSDGVNSGSDEIDIKDEVESVDFGFNAGLAYDFNDKFFAEMRYNLGLSNVFDIDGEDLEAFNRVFQVSLGFRF